MINGKLEWWKTYKIIGYNGKNWVAYFYLLGPAYLQIGISIFLPAPNIEIHVPFGYFRFGRKRKDMS